MRPVAYALVEALFRVVFTYDCLGEEHVPASGPAVVASNHPSYLDPILISLQVRRPIRFMAYHALFKVPLLGTMLRAFGAFPVDTRPGRGREAYARARALVEAGEVVGIFPEGRRSRTGWMEASLREGAARLAWETGAPLVPATITGAFRAWPYFRALPTPARVRVRFHEPIDPAPFRHLPEEEALPGLLRELRRRVERSLLPGVKADLRTIVLYQGRAPRLRIHEWLAPAAYALVAWPRLGPFAALAPALAYVLYVALDMAVIPQSRMAKRVRNASALGFVLAIGPLVFRALGAPLHASAALVAAVAGTGIPYVYERGQVAVGFVRGAVMAFVFELGVSWWAPAPAGPHLALSVFAAAYAWDRGTVFWRYAVPALAAYAAGAAVLLGGSGLILHALAGLSGWLATRQFPYHRPLLLAPGAVAGTRPAGSSPADGR